jgi:hypothetical protein
MGFLSSLIWLISFPPRSRGGTAALVGLFLLCAAVVVIASWPYWKRWKRVQQGLAAAAVTTGLLLGLLQILPGDNRLSSGTSSSSESTTSTSPHFPPQPTPPEGGREVQPPAVVSCIQQVRALSEDNPPTAGDDLVGRVWLSTNEATTVVVADRRWTWTCNLEPDIATSSAGNAVISDPEPADFSVAYWHGSDGVFTWWSGGALPAGAAEVKFNFPDGQGVYAETKDGYWVMQHRTRSDYKWDDRNPIVVEVAGPRSYPDGKHSARLALRWGVDTCQQVNHGC